MKLGILSFINRSVLGAKTDARYHKSTIYRNYQIFLKPLRGRIQILGDVNSWHDALGCMYKEVSAPSKEKQGQTKLVHNERSNFISFISLLETCGCTLGHRQKFKDSSRVSRLDASSPYQIIPSLRTLLFNGNKGPVEHMQHFGITSCHPAT